jgi:DNA-binding NarL/FixJ family response regulator
MLTCVGYSAPAPSPAPVCPAVETTRQLTELHPAVAIVVLTTYAGDTSILAALSAGARSYLTKNADRVEIASAARPARIRRTPGLPRPSSCTFRLTAMRARSSLSRRDGPAPRHA